MESPETQRDVKDNLPQPPLQATAKRQRCLQFLFTLLFIGGCMGIWRIFTPESPQVAANIQMPPKKVKVSPVELGNIEDTSELMGRIESRRSVILQARIQGQVTRILIKSGDRVKQGQAMIQVDSREQQASLNSVSASADAALSQLANSQATLKSLQADSLSNIADVKFNEQEYQRYADLAEEGAVSQQTKDIYANRLANAKAKLGAIEARIQAQQAAVSQAKKALQQTKANIQEQKVQLQYYRITAPFRGIVGDILVKEGDFVNTTSPLANITQNKALEVEIYVPIEKQRKLRRGIPLEIMDAQGRLMAKTKVYFIAQNASNETQSILIKALLSNSQNNLRTDQRVRARLIWSQHPGVLVPTFAVSRIAGENFVYVAETGKSDNGTTGVNVKQKRVKLGNITGNSYQILSGLEPGDKIVVSGIMNLRDGDRILPE
ncbi:MAG: efflux RND transporter periplasmic adaptor subunit [Richelia sp.]|nr:efflux RND transporter periplasmic adaptor subunit [Richelia sp.]